MSAPIVGRDDDGTARLVLPSFPSSVVLLAHVCIDLPPISWKNTHEAVKQGGKATIIHNAAGREWMREAVRQLRQQWGERPPLRPLRGHFNAMIHSYFKSKRNLPDASNAYQGPEDALQEYLPGKDKRTGLRRRGGGVIDDDKMIGAHDGSGRFIDEHRPRTEIWLTEPWR